MSIRPVRVHTTTTKLFQPNQRKSIWFESKIFAINVYARKKNVLFSIIHQATLISSIFLSSVSIVGPNYFICIDLILRRCLNSIVVVDVIQFRLQAQSKNEPTKR